MRNASAIASLRAQIARIEGQSRQEGGVLPFGLTILDAKLPGGGLALGALHEVAGGGPGTVDGAAAALFSAGIAARTEGPVFWICTQPDLFAPSLAQAGLPPDRVIYVQAGDDKTVLACTEEALRHGSLGAVVAEVASLNMTASRRLQLAVEGKRTIGIALRRWRRQADAADFGQRFPASPQSRAQARKPPSILSEPQPKNRGLSASDFQTDANQGRPSGLSLASEMTFMSEGMIIEAVQSNGRLKVAFGLEKSPARGGALRKSVLAAAYRQAPYDGIGKYLPRGEPHSVQMFSVPLRWQALAQHRWPGLPPISARSVWLDGCRGDRRCAHRAPP